MKKPTDIEESGKKPIEKNPDEPLSSKNQNDNSNPVKSIAEITKEMTIKGILENAKLSEANENLVNLKGSDSK